MPAQRTIHDPMATKYEYKTIKELYDLNQRGGAKWCLYGVVKFCREINSNCMLLGICDATSYGKGPKGASCLLYRESFAGMIELPIQVEVGQLIRLHRMKITNYKPESGCIQLKSSNYYSWLIFNGKSDRSHDPVAQSSFSYSFSKDDCLKIDNLRAWLLSFSNDETLYNQLDFQFSLPESKLNDSQSAKINKNEKNISKDNDYDEGDSDETEFFSASDEIGPSKKRVRVNND